MHRVHLEYILFSAHFFLLFAKHYAIFNFYLYPAPLVTSEFTNPHVDLRSIHFTHFHPLFIWLTWLANIIKLLSSMPPILQYSHQRTKGEKVRQSFTWSHQMIYTRKV